MKKPLRFGNKLKLVVTSGYFDILHVGHIRYLNEARSLGDLLFVIVNNDEQAKLKKGFNLVTADERIEIIQSLESVSLAIKAIDKNESVIESIRLIHKNFFDIADIIFAKGGDRTIDNIPEREICEKLNIEMRFNIGGEKVQSSSELLKKYGEKK